MQYSVKEVAEKYGISSYTIRYYDNMGLFPNTTRDSKGARVFNDEQLSWLNLVLCMRSTGMSINEIRRYIELSEKGDETLEERYSIILTQKAQAEKELVEINHKLELLSKKQKHYEELIAAAKK